MVFNLNSRCTGVSFESKQFFCTTAVMYNFLNDILSFLLRIHETKNLFRGRGIASYDAHTKTKWIACLKSSKIRPCD